MGFQICQLRGGGVYLCLPSSKSDLSATEAWTEFKGRREEYRKQVNEAIDAEIAKAAAEIDRLQRAEKE